LEAALEQGGCVRGEVVMDPSDGGGCCLVYVDKGNGLTLLRAVVCFAGSVAAYGWYMRTTRSVRKVIVKR
jgi:hypothetical protein